MKRFVFDPKANKNTRPAPQPVILSANETPVLAYARQGRYSRCPHLVIKGVGSLPGFRVYTPGNVDMENVHLEITLGTNDAGQLYSSNLNALNEVIELLTNLRDSATEVYSVIESAPE